MQPHSKSASPLIHILHGLSEGQVLQRLGSRGATAQLTGKAAEPGALTATILDARKKRALPGWKLRRVGQAARGKFVVKLTGIPTGGPYRLELASGGAKAVVAEFFVGDVWLLGGQSNMEGCGNRGGAAGTHPLVRAFSMRREWRLAKEPLHVLGESPDFCHNNGRQLTPAEAEKFRHTTLKGVGCGLFFAHDMLRRTGVPQGLVCVAHGGTSMAQWDPALRDEGGRSLYASALASVAATGQPVAGMLWYQGESDATPAEARWYTLRMKALVRAFRRDLRQPALPWLVVQIARVNGVRTAADIPAWNSIQEQQRKLPREIPALETVSAIDLELDDGIHISAQGYPLLALRLARTAARLVHRDRREARPPQLKGLVLKRDPNNAYGFVVEVQFDSAPLHAEGKPNGFAIVTPEGQDLNAIYKTTLHGSTARLHINLPLVEGLRVHHGFGCYPYCNITDARGYALPVFGPLPLSKPAAVLPFVTSWHATGVVADPAPLAGIAPPGDIVDHALIKTCEADGFFNQRDLWMGKSGHAYFSAKLTLPEPMRLDFRMAYDGPFRLWVDREPFFEDLGGTNPCTPDKAIKPASLPAGEHDLRIAMDLNGGNAWGFRLRFERKDVTQAQVKSGKYAKPVYSV
ncbi:MAG TPA: sialate O-acetylesterase [Candidatus Methylacidiphilales bacterium]|jgi:sialate O-acetylesterase|nr:sialate O-acetylesterase [Candidatus Methylacidiphilales bacterium]